MVCNPKVSPSSWRPLAVAGVLAAAAVALPARAATVVDPANDFLATYTGPHNGDMDVLSVSAVRDATDVTLTAILNGPVGSIAGEAYVLGINRGGGLPLLTFGTPPVGAGVNFDAVAVLLPGGGSFVDVLLPTAMAPTALSDVTFSGATLKAVIPFSQLPTNGFTTAQYLYNLWPRDGLNTADNGQIADFAPDASSFAASVPEPAAWATMLLGFGTLGAVLRRRRRLAPA
ncbi:MAG: PEPxxWA-CTERM sorting domain-containing protein [Caulobacterales bacterium]|jgi:hypothetical protein